VFATGGNDGCRGRCGDHHLGLIEAALGHLLRRRPRHCMAVFRHSSLSREIVSAAYGMAYFGLGRLLSGGIADPERQPGVLDLCWKDSGFRSLALYDIPHLALSNNITLSTYRSVCL
jgi:hypothetical protein